jgi:2-polyprenyl-3-methyl-5-hydroxy-6-metoxy-1,4-benzoquinol methylase
MGKASWCFITDEYVVKSYSSRNKKSVKPARGSLYDCWLRETECLERLKGHLHFPQIIGSDDKDYSLAMTLVGDSLFNTWHEHDLDQYIDQAHTIADALEKQNIMYFYPGMDPASNQKDYAKFPLSNFCIDDGELSLIDFEMSCPIDSLAHERLSDRLSYLYTFYNKDHFRKSLVATLSNPRQSWESELMAKLVHKEQFKKLREQNPRELWETMTMFTQPPEKVINEWNKYQKRYGINDAKDRVKRMKLVEVAESFDRPTLIDIGCNDGFITKLISNHVAKAVGVEPFVKLSDDKKTSNLKWYRGTFNDYLKFQQDQFDILLSLAVSIQLRDFGGLTEEEIVDGYYSLLAPGGIVVHETQKLENRPNNQQHTAAMLESFRARFTQIDHGQARPSGQREYYHFKKD